MNTTSPKIKSISIVNKTGRVAHKCCCPYIWYPHGIHGTTNMAPHPPSCDADFHPFMLGCVLGLPPPMEVTAFSLECVSIYFSLSLHHNFQIKPNFTSKNKTRQKYHFISLDSPSQTYHSNIILRKID